MTPGLALVQTITAYSPIAKINDLERQIIDAQDDADACQWEQAAIVVQLLQTMTQRALAAQWSNPRTGKPYTQRHVWIVAHAYEYRGIHASFTDAYQAARRGHLDDTDTPTTADTPAPAPAAPAVAGKSKADVAARIAQCRAMAEDGHSVDQIAQALQIGRERISVYAKKYGITIHAKCMAGTHRHDPNRIVDQMVMDAEYLTADIDLIDFKQIDKTRLTDWIASFAQSQVKLREFIRTLKELAR